MSAEKNKDLVDRMCRHMTRNVSGGMEEFWAEVMVWYGPVPIGEWHGSTGFYDGTRIPFNRAFPDNFAIDEIRIAEGDYVAAHG